MNELELGTEVVGEVNEVVCAEYPFAGFGEETVALGEGISDEKLDVTQEMLAPIEETTNQETEYLEENFFGGVDTEGGYVTVTEHKLSPLVLSAAKNAGKELAKLLAKKQKIDEKIAKEVEKSRITLANKVAKIAEESAELGAIITASEHSVLMLTGGISYDNLMDIEAAKQAELDAKKIAEAQEGENAVFPA